MILVDLNKTSFEYDIHSLVKAFYPPENVCVCTEKKNLTEEVSHWLGVTFLDDQRVRLEFRDPGREKVQIRKEGHKLFYDYDFSGWISLGERTFLVEPGNRKATKNILKQELYRLLEEMTGQSLPWGTLTGIRPTKFALDLLEEGRSEAEIEAFMAETFYTPKDKIDLSLQIARRELDLLRRLDYQRGYSLYVGIPFCPSTCLYCSFPSYSLSMWKDKVDAYLDALEKEMTACADKMRDFHLNTVYIGGGTPTTLSPDQLDRLLSDIKRIFGIRKMPTGTLEDKSREDLLEFTLEAGRPDSITEDKLQVIKTQGVSRISINPQTMKQATLDLIGRHHRVDQVLDSFALARSMGFDNINMDLIMGLPEESLEDVEHTLRMIKDLDPDNVTVHSLAIKRAARLNLFKEDYAGLQMVNTPRHLALAADYCGQMGMSPYYLYRQKNMAGNFENVGYAKPGKAGIYNILIMEERQTILALGAGATTKLVIPRKGRGFSFHREEAAVPRNSKVLSDTREGRGFSLDQDEEMAVSGNGKIHSGSGEDRRSSLRREEAAVEKNGEKSSLSPARNAEDPVQISRIGNVKDVGIYIDKIDQMIGRKIKELDRLGQSEYDRG